MGLTPLSNMQGSKCCSYFCCCLCPLWANLSRHIQYEALHIYIVLSCKSSVIIMGYICLVFWGHSTVEEMFLSRIWLLISFVSNPVFWFFNNFKPFDLCTYEGVWLLCRVCHLHSQFQHNTQSAVSIEKVSVNRTQASLPSSFSLERKNRPDVFSNLWQNLHWFVVHLPDFLNTRFWIY